MSASPKPAAHTALLLQPSGSKGEAGSPVGPSGSGGWRRCQVGAQQECDYMSSPLLYIPLLAIGQVQPLPRTALISRPRSSCQSPDHTRFGCRKRRDGWCLTASSTSLNQGQRWSEEHRPGTKTVTQEPLQSWDQSLLWPWPAHVNSVHHPDIKNDSSIEKPS